MKRLLAALPLVWLVGCSGCADVKQEIGEGVGYLELVGFRYPVKKYHEDVSGLPFIRSSRIDSVEGYQKLRDAGVDEIVDFRAEVPNDSTLGADKFLAVESIPMIDNEAMTMDQCQTLASLVAIKAAANLSKAPKDQKKILGHCEAGLGRTGEGVACLRTQIQCWTGAQAWEEMLQVAMRYGKLEPTKAQKDWVLALEPPTGCVWEGPHP